MGPTSPTISTNPTVASAIRRGQERFARGNTRASASSPATSPATPKGQAAEPEGEHLPGRPGPLAEDEVAGKRRHRTHEEPGLGAGGEPCDHNDGGHGLEMRHPDERRAGRHGERRQHGHHGNFARRGTSPFEGDEEGHDSVQHDERAGEVVAVAGDGHTRDCGQRREHQRRKNRQDRLDSGATALAEGLGGAGSFGQLRHSSTTSSTVTTFSKKPRLMRLAAVV